MIIIVIIITIKTKIIIIIMIKIIMIILNIKIILSIIILIIIIIPVIIVNIAPKSPTLIVYLADLALCYIDWKSDYLTFVNNAIHSSVTLCTQANDQTTCSHH